MNYPKQILPHTEFQLIVADLSGYFLLRITRTNEKNELIDQVTGKPNLKHVCSPSDHIIDFSCSLLGIYTPEHISIQLTDEGRHVYNHYCDPDITVEVPVFNTHFTEMLNRSFWCVPISELNGREFPYPDSKDPTIRHVVTCLVRHTPMMWNFWHFSLHWDTSDGVITSKEVKASKKIIQKVAHSARALLSEILSFELPEHNLIPEEYYKKKEELAN